jgi:hypothetical protein
LAIVTGITAFNRIDETRSVTDKIAQLAQLVRNENEVRQLKDIGGAWKFMKERLDLTFQYEGVDEKLAQM